MSSDNGYKWISLAPVREAWCALVCPEGVAWCNAEDMAAVCVGVLLGSTAAFWARVGLLMWGAPVPCQGITAFFCLSWLGEVGASEQQDVFCFCFVFHRTEKTFWNRFSGVFCLVAVVVFLQEARNWKSCHLLCCCWCSGAGEMLIWKLTWIWWGLGGNCSTGIRKENEFPYCWWLCFGSF